MSRDFFSLEAVEAESYVPTEEQVETKAAIERRESAEETLQAASTRFYKEFRQWLDDRHDQVLDDTASHAECRLGQMKILREIGKRLDATVQVARGEHGRS